MAISPALDVKVSIKHNSEALPEHINREATPDNDETAFKHIIRYIQVPDADDREFSIHVDFDALDPTALLGTALEWHIVVDGRPVDGIVITPSMIESHYSNGRTCLSRGQYASGRVRPFKFANLEVGATEEAEEKLDDTRKSGLGTIRVEVHHVELRGVSHSQSNTQNSGVSNLGRLAEKDLKGRPIAHSVSFGDSQEDRVWTEVDQVTYVDHTLTPAVVYEFRYRSLEGLKSEGIVPRTPSPTPEPEVDPAEVERQRQAAEEAAALAEWNSLSQEQQFARFRETRRQIHAQAEVKKEIKQETLDRYNDARGIRRPRAPLRNQNGKRSVWVIDDDDQDFTVVEEDDPDFSPPDESTVLD